MAKNRKGGGGSLWLVLVAIGLAWLIGTDSGIATLRTLLILGAVTVVILLAFWILGSRSGSGRPPWAPRSNTHVTSNRTEQDGVYRDWTRARARPVRPPYQPGDGLGFEVHVKALLEELGYQVELTAGSADRGVDHVAVKKRESIVEKLVVQAKNHQSPAGFGAVQAIFAGKALHHADEAWVVSTNGFTKQAIQEAKPLGVKLLTIHELTSRADYLWDTSTFRGAPSQQQSRQPAGPVDAGPASDRRPEAEASSSPSSKGNDTARPTHSPTRCWKCRQEIVPVSGSDGLATCSQCGSRTLIG